jgi:6-phosphogluconolactonase
MSADRPDGSGMAPAGEPEVVVVADADAVARSAAERIIAALGSAIAANGIAHWATTGGSSPAGIYRALVAPPLRDAVDWSRVHLWWGDERLVSRRDPSSNVAAADEILLDRASGVPLSSFHVHPWPCEQAVSMGQGPEWVVQRYVTEVSQLVPTGPGGRPAFDVVLVGIGPDGHVLSVFPGSAAFDTDAVALPVPAPTHIEPSVERVTFSPRILDDARALLAVAMGSAKAAVLADLLGPVRDERRWPAQRARRAGATWILDEAAAAELGGR